MIRWFFYFSLSAHFFLALATSHAAEAPLITISGADENLRNNIQSHLRISGEECTVGIARLLRLQGQVRSNVERAAQALGYYQSDTDIEFSETENCWALLITIEPGEAVVIASSNIAIEGESIAEFDELIASSSLLPGSQLNHGSYESLKSNLSALAVENGFFAARFIRSELNINLLSNTAGIDLLFAPGPRYYIGEISLSNESILSNDFVLNLFQLQEGDPYSNSELINLRSNLDRSQYFSQVSISPQLSRTANLSVPLLIELEARPRHEYSTGIGFTTDTGPRIRLGYENRYQTSKGHRLNADISISPIRQQSNVNYTMPLNRNPLRESIQYSAGYINEDNDTFESERFELETAYRNESDTGWLRNTFVNYQRDNYLINLQADTSFLTILGFNISKTSADNVLNPSRGWKIFAELSGASDSLISDTSFMQTNISGKYIRSLNSISRVLLKFDSGFTWIDEKIELPVSLRFLSGGDQSLRGYKYNSLGPTDINGLVIGGKHLLNGGVEFDFSFRPNWRFATFYDSGNAFNDFNNIDWKHSIGVGLRWLSPIGPIRFDLAHALNDVGGVHVHITMGPDL